MAKMIKQLKCFSTFFKKALFTAAATLMMFSTPPALALTQVGTFGTNPGNLLMYKHVPSNMPQNAALVIALHDCTQSAAAYEASGWTTLADTYKFYVVYPQQQFINNQRTCFNWFEPGDNTRGYGEALSIKQMVDKMKLDYSIHPYMVYVTGLGAGGYMANVMAATYPDVFVGAAPIAGGPYKCASSILGASSCMNPGVDKTPAAWGDLARNGYSGYTGQKPRISIWQGTSDTTVNPMNMDETMQQWTNYHGTDQTPKISDTVLNYPHRVYWDAHSNAVVETYSITNMGHGTPVDPGTGSNQCGTAGTYSPDANICSSYYIGKFFGIVPSGGGGNTTTTTTTQLGGTNTLYTTTTTSSTAVSSTTTTTAGMCYTASNYSHVTGGRAYNSNGNALANGSNQNMGSNNNYVITKLRKKDTNYYVIDSSCP